MLNKFREFYKEILGASIALLIGLLLFNLFNYAFQIVVARKLGPSLYGEFGAIISVLYLFSIIGEIINTFVVKFASKLKSEKRFSEMKGFFVDILKKVMFGYLVILISLAILSPIIAGFLKLNSILPVILLLIYLVNVAPLLINRGFMQAFLKFNSYSLSIVIEAFFKFLLAVVVLYIGFKVNGVLIAIIFSGLLTVILSFIPIRQLFLYKTKKFDSKIVITKSKNMFIVLAAITAIYSIDIFLAKHFLAPTDAGLYMALSLLGKSVFFGSFAVVKAMFPKLSELDLHEKRILALKAFSIISAGIILVLVAFFVAPEQIVGLFFGESYLGMAKYLFEFSFAMSLFSIVFLIIHYTISKDENFGTIILPSFLIVEIILINILNTSLASITHAMFITMTSLFITTATVIAVRGLRNALKS